MDKYTIVGLMTVHNKLVQVRHEVTEDPIYIASKLYITHGWISNSKGDVIYIIDDSGNITPIAINQNSEKLTVNIKNDILNIENYICEVFLK